MPISIQTREDTNNASILQPIQQIGKLTLRPLSLGSIEILRSIGNPLATGNIAAIETLDTSAFAQFIWVHAAAQEEVLDIVFNRISELARAVTTFALAISPADLQAVAKSLQGDMSAIEAASAQPESTDNASPNVQAPH